MKAFRQIIFWAHLVTALGVGIVVLVMSVTGVLLTYQRQMQWWADTRGLDSSAPAASGARRLDTGTILRGVAAQVEGTPTAVTWRSDPEAPTAVVFARGRTVYVNAYTGAVLGEGSTAVRSFFRQVTDWHRWLGRSDDGRDVGRAVTGASNLGFLFLVLSGFYLWWPRNLSRRAVRNVILFRRGLSGKARDFNWHNVIGFWSAVPLAVVVASGAVISYPWASDLVYRIAGDAPPSSGGRSVGAGPAGGPGPRGGGPGGAGRGGQAAAPATAGPFASTATLEARAERQVEGWRSISLQLPETPGEEVSFSIDAGSGGQPQKRAQLVLDRATGEVVRWEPFATGTPGRRLRSILRFAHTGEVAGLIGQTVAGLASLGAVVLVWTGIALTWRRFSRWRSRGGDAERGSRRAPRREPAGSR